MLGIAGSWLFLKIQRTASWPRYIPALTTLAIILLIQFRPANISYHVGLIAPLFLLLILSISKTSTTILNHPFFVYMGEISYAIYILQYPLYQATDILLKEQLHIQNQTIRFFLFLAILISSSAILHKAVEQPHNKLANKRKAGADNDNTKPC